jgi:hypothetical protein
VSEEIQALIPPIVMALIFLALLVTAFRATDGVRRKDDDEDGPAPSG